MTDITENIPVPQKRNWRPRALITLLLLGWLALTVRLIDLQWNATPYFAESAGRQQVFLEPVSAHPGDILDRNGRLLATSIAKESLWVNPNAIKNRKTFAAQIAPLLQLDQQTLEQQLNQHRQKKFLWLRRRLDQNSVAAVQKLKQTLKLPADALGFRQEYQRYYPQGTLAAHLLGLRGIDNRGHGGIEQTFDHLLQGTAGQRTLIRDSRRKVLEIRDESSVPPRHGKSITLTIDTMQQLIVEQELDKLMEKWKPKSAGVIVVDPHTGEILAMASRPAFDPNRPINVPKAAWKNINIASAFEPGSTFKPLIVAAALQKKLIRPDEKIHCGWGKHQMGPRLLHDHHPYGELDIETILVKSSNVGMAKIGERLTNAGLYETVTAFGFGKPTRSGLPGEIGGLLHPLSKWTIYSTGSIPMGQEIAVTPLQLIMAHAALANGGRLISPQLIRHQQNHTNQFNGTNNSLNRPIERRVVSPIIDRPIADWLVQKAMTAVVKRGTGRRAQLPDDEVFGKTGTAQKIDPETGRYSRKKVVCSFIGGAPAKKPQRLVLVVVDEPSVGTEQYGATVAAPTVGRILQQLLAAMKASQRNRVVRRKSPVRE